MTHGCFFIAPKNLPVFSTFSIEFNSWQDEEEASVAIENFRLKTWVYFSGSWSNKSTWLTFFVSIIIWFVKLYYFSISVLLVLRNVAHYEKGALFDTWLLGQKKRPFHRGLQSPSRTSSFHLMLWLEKNRLSLVQSGKEPNQTRWENSSFLWTDVNLTSSLLYKTTYNIWCSNFLRFPFGAIKM